MLDQDRIDAAVARAIASVDRLHAAEAYGGANPMEHHKSRGPSASGMDGAAEMFARLGALETPKYLAGHALVQARVNRALGNPKGVRIALARAAEMRREAQRRSVGWGLNQYRDGSGGTPQIWPAKSEEEARQIVRDLLEKAFDAWRTGDDKWWHGHIGVAATLKANPWFTPPEDWIAHQERGEAEKRAAEIARLREKIEALENEQ